MGKQFIVTFRVPPLNEKMIKVIPRQRAAVDDLMANGIVMSYSLTKNMDKLYIIFNVDNEEELKEQILKMPLARIMSYQFRELYFHLSSVSLPSISMN